MNLPYNPGSTERSATETDMLDLDTVTSIEIGGQVIDLQMASHGSPSD
ncbi:MAG: hypothetical protein FWB97_09320 [Oscillospiraceae bacterium]|nr:hypothetical protein [Oscillospiraceae bacterium]MCL2227805.1 hypothetical protein [Oscillospiraceae bacterium]